MTKQRQRNRTAARRAWYSYYSAVRWPYYGCTSLYLDPDTRLQYVRDYAVLSR